MFFSVRSCVYNVLCSNGSVKSPNGALWERGHMLVQWCEAGGFGCESKFELLVECVQIPDCKESKSLLGDFTAGMWLLVMLLSISELRSGVGSSLTVFALILPSKTLFLNAFLMGLRETRIECSPILWFTNSLSCLKKKLPTCYLMNSHCGSNGE